jgi:hypothetical protein
LQVALTTAAYEARSIIADAQRCVNLYIERNPEDAPYPFTHYPTPGLLTRSTAPLTKEVRGIYTASNGKCYVAVYNKLYQITDDLQTFWELGTLTSFSGQVSMKDNGLALIVVDGTSDGWAVDLVSNEFAQIIAPGFYGSPRVDYLDTFFIFSRPFTNQFYISLSNVTFGDLTGGPIVSGSITSAGSAYTDATYSSVNLTGGSGTGAVADITVAGNVVTTVTITEPGEAYRIGDVLSAATADIGGSGSGFAWTVSAVTSSAFDPLDIAAKTGSSDLLQVAAVMHREISLIGKGTSEVWYNSGAADFTFQAMPGAFIEHGCQATQSVAKYDLALYWLGQDSSGNSVVFRESSYKVDIVSTRAMAAAFNDYVTKEDAIGFCYEQDGHPFYVLTFVGEDTTWVYDILEGHWHQRAWTDANGELHRWRVNCLTVFNGQIIAGDFENGKIYQVDINTYQDDGEPISRIRSFPHIVQDGDRVIYKQFQAAMQTGEPLAEDTTDGLDVTLRMSDNAGKSYGNGIMQTLGAAGDYLAQASWWRLGYARDRVFELSWSSPKKTALSGAYVDIMQSGT